MKARAKPRPSMVVQSRALEGGRRERRRRANMATTPGLVGVVSPSPPDPLSTTLTTGGISWHGGTSNMAVLTGQDLLEN